MRLISLFILLFLAQWSTAQTDEALLNRYLDAIRQNPAELTALFNQMPKGGDLHHHFSGSIYAENYLQAAIDSNLWVNTTTMAVQRQPDSRSADWLRFSELEQQGRMPKIRETLLRRWSVKDYPFQAELPSDQHFFATFEQFGDAKGDFSPRTRDAFAKGLLEIKHRAGIENVQYIETMFAGIRCKVPAQSLRYNDSLHVLQAARNEAGVQNALSALYLLLRNQEAEQCVQHYNQLLQSIHDSLRLDDENFTLRYQTYTIRTIDPVLVFSRLLLCFMAAEESPLIVGANIVAPENDPVSMQDYWLHMQMYRFLHRQFPDVQYAMHAGELVLGMVPPEELSWHIRDAVLTAGARRIGHGVDIAHETDCYALLDSMRRRDVAVEINLTSNEFILGVKDSRHPVTLYHHANVPLVISTDDAGVLRSSHTEQYVLLAMRYPEFSYTDIKQLVFNSINYAFLEESGVETALVARLEARFGAFEDKLLRELERRKF